MKCAKYFFFTNKLVTNLYIRTFSCFACVQWLQLDIQGSLTASICFPYHCNMKQNFCQSIIVDAFVICCLCFAYLFLWNEHFFLYQPQPLYGHTLHISSKFSFAFFSLVATIDQLVVCQLLVCVLEPFKSRNSQAFTINRLLANLRQYLKRHRECSAKSKLKSGAPSQQKQQCKIEAYKVAYQISDQRQKTKLLRANNESMSDNNDYTDHHFQFAKLKHGKRLSTIDSETSSFHQRM